jgi:hypothetical protein
MGGAGRLMSAAGNPKVEMVDMLCKAFQNQFIASLVGSMFGNPNGSGPDEKCGRDTSGGSGPFRAKFFDDPSLANHTIYAPITPPPPGTKLPVLVWSNGFCLQVGTMFENFLTEIASHGFIAISNGPVIPMLSNLDNYKDLIASIDWASTAEAKKYGDIDTDAVIVGGQSCGGVEAMAASKDPRVKLSMIFNSGGLSTKQMTHITHPVAYFLGGVKDVGYPLVSLLNYITTPE